MAEINYVSTTMDTGPLVKEALEKIKNYFPSSFAWVEIPSTVEVNLTSIFSTSLINGIGNYVVHQYINGPAGITRVPLNIMIRSNGSSGYIVCIIDDNNRYTAEFNPDFTLKTNYKKVEITSTTIPLFYKGVSAPTTYTENTFWVDTSNYTGSSGYIDIKYYDTASSSWKTIFNSSDKMTPSIYNTTNKTSPIFTYFNDTLEAAVGEYGTFVKHKANELALIHVTAEEKITYNTELVSVADITSLINSVYRTQLTTAIDTRFETATHDTENTEIYNTAVTNLATHKTGHISETDITNWNNKSSSDHTHTNDDKVTISAEDITAGTFALEQLPDEIKERYYKINALSDLGDTTITDAERKGKYHNGNSMYLEAVDTDGFTYYRWFKIIDSNKIGTASYMDGIIEYTSQAKELTWANIGDKPTTLAGYKLDGLTKSKTQIDEITNSMNSDLSSIEATLRNITALTELPKSIANIDRIGFQKRLTTMTTYDDMTENSSLDCIIHTSDGKVYKSGYITGEEWTQTTLPSSSWCSICYGNGKYVVIARDSNISAYSIDGITWTSSTLPSSQNWRSVCYGNGKFVVVASYSNISAYSTDGITWTSSTLPSSANWYFVCYGNGKYVAVVINSNISAYSTDGINWTQTTLPSSKSWYSVCYGNGKYVTIARDSNISAYSIDGINWTSSTLPSSKSWNSVCYGNGKYVTVAYSSSISAYSTDGITWTSSTLPVNGGWRSVCYGNGKYVTVAYNTNISAYSTDGITWTQSTLPSSANWISVCYGNGKYVTIAADSNISAYLLDPVLLGITYVKLPYSTTDANTYFNNRFASNYANDSDNPNWSTSGCGMSIAVTTSGSITNKVYDNITLNLNYSTSKIGFLYPKNTLLEKMIGIVDNGDATIASLNNNLEDIYSKVGIKPGATLPISTFWKSICYGNGKYVAVANGNISAYSTDGINWTQATLPSSTWLSVCYGNGKYVTVAYDTNISAYSTDGITWISSTLPSSQYWQSVCYGNDKYVTVAGNTNISAYSTDGITWTQSTLPSNTSWQSVCYGNGKYVTVAYGNTNISAYSTDGINWTQSTLPSSSNWYSVCYGNDKYVAVASDTNISAYSTDGIVWTSSTLSSSQEWQSVCYGNGKYVTVAYDTNISAYSTDGITWISSTLPSSQEWISVCYGNGKYVTVADSSNISAQSLDGITWY